MFGRSRKQRRARRQQICTAPFFFEGESVSGLFAGVDVATLGGRMLRDSVGVTGLREEVVLSAES